MSPVSVSFTTPQQRRPEMATIYVKARSGRRIPFEGKIIPTDEFIPVPDGPYIRRFIQHWEDLEVQGELPKTAPRQPRTTLTPSQE